MSDSAPATPAVASWMYRLTSGLGIVGVTAGTFAATVITNDLGGESLGALVTAVWIVLLVGGRLLVAPYLPLVIGKYGARRTFLSVKILSAVLWVLLGALLQAGVLGASSLYAAAPFLGALAAFASTLTTLYSAAYLNRHDVSGALARMAVVRGGAVAAGAALAALLVLTIGPAWAIMTRGAFEIPLIIFLLFVRPSQEPRSPQVRRHVWRGLRDDIRDNRTVRLLVVLGIGLTIFAMPFSELLVPITSQLRASDAIQGAALLVASLALGQSLSIFPVDALRGRCAPARAAALMGGIRGLALLLFGLSALATAGGWELGVWVVIGLCFGAVRAASGALMTGAVITSVDAQDSSRALVAFSFACTLASPLGLLLWGAMITVAGVEWTLLGAGLGVLAVSAYVLRRAPGSPARP